MHSWNLQNSSKINFFKTPSMEKHTMFIDWRTPKSKNISTSQIDLCLMQFLSNLVKIFVDTDKLIPKFM